jgi:hypothetical protein
MGGLFCYIYVLILFVYGVTLTLKYARDEPEGLNKDFQYINETSSPEIATFDPYKETGFNVAFGFPGRNLPKNIGHWSVKYISRTMNTTTEVR